MEANKSRLTVYFEEPFWVAVLERESDGSCEACKVTFGAEPNDYEVLDYFQKNYRELRFSPPVPCGSDAERRINPKRMQRDISSQLRCSGVGTKAQQALKLQQEQGKLEHKQRSREMREKEEQRKFELRQTKKKEKHRGR